MTTREKDIYVNVSYHLIYDEKYRRLEGINSTPEYKEYRRKWVENPKNLILENAPIHIDIEPTNICNLKCPMCKRTIMYEDNSFTTGMGFMDFDLYKEIIDDASKAGVCSVKLIGDGEDLLHKSIVDMITYAKGRGIIDVMMVTNATLLSEKIANDIINSGLDKIAFSFDSVDEQIYESIRVGAKFKQTLENIKRFCMLRDKSGKTKPITRIAVTIMENNKNEIDKFIKIFGDYVDAISCLDYVENRKDQVDYSVLESDMLKNYICPQPWQRLIISWDGKYGACCRDNHYVTNLGNAKDLSIKEVWHGSKMNAFRKMHLNGKAKQYEMCRDCQAGLFMAKNNIADGSI